MHLSPGGEWSLVTTLTTVCGVVAISRGTSIAWRCWPCFEHSNTFYQTWEIAMCWCEQTSCRGRGWDPNNEDADPHTILNALLVLAMIERKLYSYQNARFKQKQSVKTKKRMMCPPGVPYIAVAPVVTSWLSPANKWCFYIVCFRHESRWRRSP